MIPLTYETFLIRGAVVPLLECVPNTHCAFSSGEDPIPVEGEDDIQFLPFLDFMGRAKLLSEPLEIGGKIKARCRDSGIMCGIFVRIY